MAIVRKTTDSRITYPAPYASLTRSRDYRDGYVQKPLLDKSLPLQYSRSIRWVANQRNVIGNDTPWDAYSTRTQLACSGKFSTSSAEMSAALSRAYSVLQEAAKLPQAELGVSLAEGKEAIGMIVDRGLRLGKAYSALRKGNFKTFVKVLGTRPLPRHMKTKWTRPKDASALWLEYWLGWAPMVGDIYNCVNVLQSDFGHLTKPLTIKGKSSKKVKGTLFYNDQWYGYEGSYDYRVTCELGCQITIENPNLLLANQLGLVNPASVAWAVVPFSFIVGWFSNVQQVLDSYTDFVGLKITRQYTTRTLRFTGSESRWYKSGGKIDRLSSVDTYGFDMERVTTLTRPKLRAWVPAGLSPSRGATAIALLLSIFSKG